MSTTSTDAGQHPWRVTSSVGAVTVVLVLVGATAWGFLSAAGTGQGTGGTGSVPAGSVALAAGAVVGDLRPGASASVRATASNSSASPLRLSSISLDTGRGSGGFAVDSAHSGCPTSAFTFATQNSAGGWTVPAKSGTANGTLDIVMPASLTMSSSAVNACQGVRVTVFVTGSGS